MRRLFFIFSNPQDEWRILTTVMDSTNVNTPAYAFTTSWSSKATLYFSKDSCNNPQTINGYHEKASETIEIWGLGDGWLMWIDYDFI